MSHMVATTTSPALWQASRTSIKISRSISPGATAMNPWKLGLLAPLAAATALLVAGLAQWVCFLSDRWQEKSLCESNTSHVKIFLKKFLF
jgi:hypothetical protein